MAGTALISRAGLFKFNEGLMDNKQKIRNHFAGHYQDFYSKYMDLSGQSGQAKISSPFRKDSDPSFRITLDGEYEGKWRDFGTDEHGDVFAFYAKLHNLDIKTDFIKIVQGIAGDFDIQVSAPAANGTVKMVRSGRPKKTPEEAIEALRNAHEVN
jgi:DNA primase